MSIFVRIGSGIRSPTHSVARGTSVEANDSAVDREMLLAEFAALRAEILQRMSLQWNIFALQLTAAGVVFSFALSNPSHTGFLLILPIISFALAGRYVSQSLSIQRIGTYIREVLEAKSELHWEAWTKTRPPRRRTLTWLNPHFLTFPGTAVIALAWVAPYVWTSHNISVGKRVLIIVIWLIGIVVTALSFQLIARIVSRYWSESWRLRFSEFPANENGDHAISGETPLSPKNADD